MEDYPTEVNTISINKSDPKQLSFSEYFYNNVDLMPVLQESFEKMKNFISYVINQMRKIIQRKGEKQIMFLSEKIFQFIINNSEKLGIPFFFQLINEEEFKNILMNLFLDDIYTKQIKELLEKIIYIFNIDYKQREINKRK